MIRFSGLPPNLIGMLSVFCGSLVLSLNDLIIKALSNSYALHQIILTRSLLGMMFVFLFIWLQKQSFHQLRTKRYREHLFRAGLMVISNISYFIGLSILPLADAVAMSFVSPLIATCLSGLILGEHVGLRRTIAVIVGLVGVIIMARPGAAMHPAAFLILLSALCYASSHIMTRRMKDSETALSFTFYTQCGFIAVSLIMGLTVGDGRFANSDDPAMIFLFRAWYMPPVNIWWLFILNSFAVTLGGILVVQAYRLAPVALIAPFEYTSIPMAILWGIVFFAQWPDAISWLGMVLICGAGLYTVLREAQLKNRTD